MVSSDLFIAILLRLTIIQLELASQSYSGLSAMLNQRRKKKSRAKPHTKWSMSIFYRMQKISFVILTSNQTISTQPQASFQFNGVVDVLMTLTHKLFATMRVYMKNRNMLMSVQNFLLRANRHWFGVYFASSVMYYRCVFMLQWVVAILSFGKSKIGFCYNKWTARLYSSYMNWAKWMQTKCVAHILFLSLSLPRTIHFYGIQSVETILAMKW